MIFGGGIFIKPEKAEAMVPVYDSVLIAQTTGGWASQVAQWLKTQWERTIRDILVKRIMDHIVNETVKWIQGGGEPKFIGNWDAFLKDAGAIAFDSVARETGLAKLCTPFGLQVKIGLLPVQRFDDRITCTLDQVVSNIENFYVDFSVGGWRGYNAMWEPQNNYYGVTLDVADEIIKRTAEQETASQMEGMAGAGFVGDKICKAGADKTNDVALNSNATYLCDPTLPNYNQCVIDENNKFAKSSGYKTDKDGKYCDSKDLGDATPGSIIGKAVGEGITSDSKWAANIQSWTSALVNAVINRVITEGMSKMREITTGESSDTSYYPPEFQTLVSQSSNYDKQTMTNGTRRFTDEWQYLLNDKNNSLSLASSTLAVLRQLEQIKSLAKPNNWPALTPYPPLVCDSSHPFTTTDADGNTTIIFPAMSTTTVQSAISALTSETETLKSKLNEASSTINQINTANFSDVTQTASAQGSYQKFIDNYTGELESIFSGINREAADVEKQAKQTEFATAQSRLNACQTAINLPGS